MELLIPCAGKSTRFPTERPKYLLTMPDGKLMIQHTTESLLPEFDRVLFAILREHDEKFHSSHRANLLRKDSEWYGQYGWDENPESPYVWRDREGLWYEQIVGTGIKNYLSVLHG